MASSRHGQSEIALGYRSLLSTSQVVKYQQGSCVCWTLAQFFLCLHSGQEGGTKPGERCCLLPSAARILDEVSHLCHAGGTLATFYPSGILGGGSNAEEL